MKSIKLIKRSIPLFLLVYVLSLPTNVQAVQDPQQATSTVTAYYLIVAMNSLCMSNGLSALIEDPIIDAVAQSTAQIMAASPIPWHIGDVSGWLM